MSQPWLVSAAILNQIGLMTSQDLKLFEHAESNMARVATLCRNAGCFSDESDSDRFQVAENLPVQEEWQIWIQAQSKRRLAYCSWVLFFTLSTTLLALSLNLTFLKLLDCQFGLLFNIPSAIPIDLLRLSMPAEETLWNAPTSEDWKQRLSEFGGSGKNPSC